jgi:hypothetical protein
MSPTLHMTGTGSVSEMLHSFVVFLQYQMMDKEVLKRLQVKILACRLALLTVFTPSGSMIAVSSF